MWFHLYKDQANLWRWRLRSGNTYIIADSAESYDNKVDALHGINLVRSTNSLTPVKE